MATVAKHDIEALGQHTDIVNIDRFNNILDQDEDSNEKETSKPLVYDCFKATDYQFNNVIDVKAAKAALDDVVDIADFIMGPAFLFGFAKVQNSCKTILEVCRREGDSRRMDDTERLAAIKTYISQLKAEFKEVEVLMKSFFG